MCCTWSPANAMEAYMHSLQLLKESCKDESNSSPKISEPECMEYISAMAAGNQARLMVDVGKDGISPSAIALAVAAKHNRGRLICVRCEEASLNAARSYLESIRLHDFVEFKLAENPAEEIRQFKGVDFAVVDCRLENCREILSWIGMNLNGSVVVVSNLFDEERGRRGEVATYGQIAKGRGVELITKSVVLPIGEGMEVTKINGKCASNGHAADGKRLKRFFVCETTAIN